MVRCGILYTHAYFIGETCDEPFCALNAREVGIKHGASGYMKKVHRESNTQDWMHIGCPGAPDILQAIYSYGEQRLLYTEAFNDFMFIWDRIITKNTDLQTRAIAAGIRDVVSRMKQQDKNLPIMDKFLLRDVSAPPESSVIQVNRYFLTQRKKISTMMQALTQILEDANKVLEEFWVVKDIYKKDAEVPMIDRWDPPPRTQGDYWNEFCKSMAKLRAGPTAPGKRPRPENGAAGAERTLTAKLAALKACA